MQRRLAHEMLQHGTVESRRGHGRACANAHMRVAQVRVREGMRHEAVCAPQLTPRERLLKCSASTLICGTCTWKGTALAAAAPASPLGGGEGGCIVPSRGGERGPRTARFFCAGRSAFAAFQRCISMA